MVSDPFRGRKTFRLLMAGPTTTHFPGTTREHLDGPSHVGSVLFLVLRAAPVYAQGA